MKASSPVVVSVGDDGAVDETEDDIYFLYYVYWVHCITVISGISSPP